MRDLVEYLAKALVEHPELVVVTQREDDEAIVIELRVSSEDMGKVIGKQGRIAKSIRTLVKASASQSEKKKIVVDIVS
ncbi:MAG: KH domain-containing protein [Peptococcaceae bacterium]|mgnify:CR=1 FL=1|nr:KH domain-containing protein [Peptococcaceae bacterium]